MRHGARPRRQLDQARQIELPIPEDGSLEPAAADAQGESAEQPEDVLVAVPIFVSGDDLEPVPEVEASEPQAESAEPAPEPTPEPEPGPPAEPAAEAAVPEPEAAAPEPAPEPALEPAPEAAAPEPVAEAAVPEPEAAAPEPARVAVPAAAAKAAAQPEAPAPPKREEDPVLERRLARIHLRTGALALARVELESLHANGSLDTNSTLDLAEVRWRTGDLSAAGEAALAYLALDGNEPLAYVIAAEAAAAAGRPTEAARHAGRVVESSPARLDGFFAGIPRKFDWPQDHWGELLATAPVTPLAPRMPAVGRAVQTPAEPEAKPAVEKPAVEPTVEPAVAPGAEPAGEIPVAEVPSVEPPPAEPAAAEPPAEPAAAEPAAEPPAPAEPAAEPPAPVKPAAEPPAAEPVPTAGPADAEIASGLAALEGGDTMVAALHLGIALRIAPMCAQTVLGAIGDRRDMALELVRGDALRLLGQEQDAGQAWASAAAELRATRSTAPEASPAKPEQTGPDVPSGTDEEPSKENS